MATPRRCWCGSEDLEAFDPGYRSCRRCETLVVAEPPASDVTRVRDETRDLYGRGYWFEHQRKLGLPDLEQRSFTDPRERCLHWLDALLRYRLPPGRSLELGSAHGGFVSLLDAAGFEAVGLELSAWVADFARRAFAVRVLEGPLEDQDLTPGSFDLIVALDVLEHLPDPMATMTRAAELLAPDGLLMVQTPCRPEGKTHARLAAEEHRFLEMLLPGEHLHLFSERGARELCRRLGLPHVVFEPAIFDHYDMFFFAGRRPLRRHRDGEVDACLSATPARRRLRVSLELYRDLTARTRDLARADADRQARKTQVDELGRLLESARAAGEDLRRRRDEERERAAELERQRDEERENAAELRRRRDEERERAAELERGVAALEREVERRQRAVRRARDETRDLHARLARERERVEERERERDELAALHQRAAGQLQNRLETGADLIGRLVETRARYERLEGWYRDLREVAGEHRQSRIYRALVRLGRWRPHDDKLERILDRPRQEGPPRERAADGDPSGELVWKIGRTAADETARDAIAVDLTALLPGGENGGAKRVAVELARGLARLEPERPFLWLAGAACHQELAALATANVRCVCVPPEPAALDRLLEAEPVGLLFAPMTAPASDHPRVPVVSLIHDLQHRTYPEFFDSAERAERERAFRRAVTISERVVTVSEYVRRTVLEHSGLPPERVSAIPNGHLVSAPDPSPERIDELLEKHRLERESFLLYPANFWPHKNHRMLLAAFSLYRRRHPEPGLRLVLTGARRPDPAPLREAARRLGLGDAVRFPGYVSDEELTALLCACRALIFPSLYEGFGMPVIEAMARGRPVLASDRAALPEVAGGAALLFDPRRPESIADAIARLDREPELAVRLGERGRARAAKIGGGEKSARAYREVLHRAMAATPRQRDVLTGVYPDGWTGRRFAVHFAGGETGRTLDLVLDSPQGDSFEPVGLTARSDGGDVRELTIPRCRSLALRCELPAEGGRLDFAVDRPFVPFDLGLNPDRRELGLRLLRCRLAPRSPAEHEVDLLAEISADG